jgi:ankyrin repeat protein
LLTAASKGFKSIAMCLMDHNAQLDVLNSKGKTALMCAAQEGQSDIVTALLQRGAEPNMKAQVSLGQGYVSI